MSRLDAIEGRLAALEAKMGDEDLVAELRRAIARATSEAEDAARLSEAAADTAHKTETLLVNMHKEIDHVLRQHLGITFEVKGYYRTMRKGWKP